MASSPKHLTAMIALSGALAITTTACGGDGAAAYDWRDRDIAWKYGPTPPSASAEHLLGTGKKRGTPIAEGWRCTLRGGTQLTVKPFKLASEHELFGEVKLMVNLYDRDSQRITILSSDTISEQSASFAFELDLATAERLYDLILYFKKV